MTLIQFKVDLYRQLDNLEWETTPVDISNYVIGSSIEVTDNVGKTKDSFSFKMVNPNRVLFLNYPDFIKENDAVRIYLWTGTRSVNTNSDLIMHGIIRSLETEYNPDNVSLISVRGTSFVDAIFRSPVNLSLKAGEGDTPTSLSSVTITQKVLDYVNSLRAQQTEMWLYTNSENPVERKNHLPFPTFGTVVFKFENAADVIDRVWSSEYTSDGRYIWWIAKNPSTDRFELYVRAKYKTASSYILEGDEELEIKASRNTDDVFNVFVYNLGRDLYGNPYEPLYIDWDSVSRYGPRWKYLTKFAKTIDEVLEEERRQNPDRFPKDEEGRFTSKFPENLSDSNPYTFAQSGVTVESNDEFNREIKRIAENKAKPQVEAISRLMAKGRPSARIVYPTGKGNLDIATVYSLTAPSRGFNNELLRCVSKRIRFWETEYELLQDEETVI